MSTTNPIGKYYSRAFEPHRKFSNFLWQWRWWLTGFACLLMLLVLNTGTIITESGVVTDTDRLSRFWVSLAFTAMSTVLVAWFISILRALTRRKVKWLVTLVLLPPTALIYMYLG